MSYVALAVCVNCAGHLPGSGKRGGSRVIYYHIDDLNHIYLIYAYSKSEHDDLTPSQSKQLSQLMKGILDET